MSPDGLERMPAAPRPSPEEALWRGTRIRLQQIAIEAGAGLIYINGTRFSAQTFQFIIDNFTMPKPADKAEKK